MWGAYQVQEEDRGSALSKLCQLTPAKQQKPGQFSTIPAMPPRGDALQTSMSPMQAYERFRMHILRNLRFRCSRWPNSMGFASHHNRIRVAEDCNHTKQCL